MQPCTQTCIRAHIGAHIHALVLLSQVQGRKLIHSRQFLPTCLCTPCLHTCALTRMHTLTCTLWQLTTRCEAGHMPAHHYMTRLTLTCCCARSVTWQLTLPVTQAGHQFTKACEVGHTVAHQRKAAHIESSSKLDSHPLKIRLLDFSNKPARNGL